MGIFGKHIYDTAYEEYEAHQTSAFKPVRGQDCKTVTDNIRAKDWDKALSETDGSMVKALEWLLKQTVGVVEGGD